MGRGRPLRVRMALHTGTAEPADGDYLGPPLNRVARLLEAAHGGQVLLSLATQELARDHLPEGARLRDLGEHRLRDLARPERLFQLLAPDLPADFPPPRTLDLHPNNLPVQPTPLLGREREVAEARERLQGDTRLLTLTGPGGTGKTRLALQVAADLLDQFSDGVSFVDLSPIRDPALVAPTIAQTLGVRESEGRSLQEALKEFLRERELLLLLDNFEQVLPAAPLVAELLAAATRLKVLVTSRAALNLRGEEQRAVPPLAVPDPRRLPPLPALSQYAAVALFIQRAIAVRADFAVTNANAPAVAEICHRLDGLPLAIELAAARVKLFSPEALLSRLSNRLKLLVGGARDLPARQQTLRDAIGWSYDLLEPGEQRLFRRLSVFAGGCTLEAAEAVCGAAGDLEIDVLDGITSLVEKSLLRQTEGVGGEPRFGMLETILEFARERLEASGEASAIGQRHAEFFTRLAERRRSPSVYEAWLAEMEREHDNVRAALAWCVAAEETELGLRLGGAANSFWVTQGYLREAKEHLARLLSLPGADAPTEGRARATMGLGITASSLGEMDRARALIQESLTLYRDMGNREREAGALLELGNIAGETGDGASARSLYEESLAISRELGQHGRVATLLNNLGMVAVDQGDHETARVYWEESAAISREVGSKRQIAGSLGKLARVALTRGDRKRARALWEEMLTDCREIGWPQGIQQSHYFLGLLRLDEGALAAARSHFVASLEVLRETGVKRALPEVLEALARLALVEGEAARGARFLGAAARVREAIRFPVPPGRRAEYEAGLAAIRAALDEEAFAAAWAEGFSAMTLEQAVACALEEESTA